MAQISALYFVAYAASAGSLMRLLLADESSGQGFNVAGGTQQECTLERCLIIELMMNIFVKTYYFAISNVLL